MLRTLAVTLEALATVGVTLQDSPVCSVEDPPWGLVRVAGEIGQESGVPSSKRCWTHQRLQEASPSHCCILKVESTGWYKTERLKMPE
jgi:hypothetical protein